jgi:hypothetical protein
VFAPGFTWAIALFQQGGALFEALKVTALPQAQPLK